MYTQCPECETTFRLGAEDLRRASGKVRCGDCNHVFNALEYLAEEVEEPATATEGALVEAEYGGWTDSSRNPDGDIEPDLDEYEASAFLDEEEPTDVFADDDDDDEGGAILYIAADDDHEEQDDDEPVEDEFDESVWEQIPGVGSALDDTDVDDWHSEDEATGEPDDEYEDDWTSEDEPVQAGAADTDDLEFNVPEDKWTNFFGPLPKGETAAVWQPPQIDDGDEASGHDGGDEAAGDEPPGSDDADEPAAATASAEAGAAEDETEEGIEDDTGLPPSWRDDAGTERSRTGLWFVGTIVAVVALGSQMIHYNRDGLAAHPAYGDNVRSLYAALGSELYPEWSIDDYEIRGSEAVAGESGADVLDIRAQIAATGDNATGLPRLRVVLRDRWSNPVAASDFGPAEYATTLPPDGLLQPGTVIDAHVSIRDPGQGAQGFELELCLPRRHDGMNCTGQPFK